MTASQEKMDKLVKELMQEEHPENGASKEKGKKKKLLPTVNGRKEQKNVEKISSKETLGPESDAVAKAMKTDIKKTVAKEARNAKPTKKNLKEESEDLSDALVNMKIQGDKGCSCKGECKTKQCGCRKKDMSCSPSCKCKPECVNNKLKIAPEEKVTAPDEEFSDDTSSDDEPLLGPPQVLNDTQELGTEEVDWERHLSKLISCPKCYRKFFPQRVEKHIEVCKNI